MGTAAKVIVVCLSLLSLISGITEAGLVCLPPAIKPGDLLAALSDFNEGAFRPGSNEHSASYGLRWSKDIPDALFQPRRWQLQYPHQVS